MTHARFSSKYVIAGATVFDGTERKPRQNDVYIEDGRIAHVRPATDFHGSWETVDADGLILTPGFIDVHSHADSSPFLDEADTTKILQGVTTEVVGNCGQSLAPRSERHAKTLDSIVYRFMNRVSWQGSTFADFFSEADRRGYVTNFAPLVGHGTLRIAAMGLDDRQPSASEKKDMEDHLDEALEAGAFGFSTGLVYPPGAFSHTEELIDLAKRLPPNAVYATHLRDQGSKLIASVEEAIRIGQAAGVRVQISHHKASGKRNWGKTRDSLQTIETARRSGMAIGQDVYPYTAGSTTLMATLPPWFQTGGTEAILSRLRDPQQLAALKVAVETGDEWENYVMNCGWDGILIASTADHRFEGRTLAQLATDLGYDPFAALVHILLEEKLHATMIIYNMDEEDVRRVLTASGTMIGTDGLGPGLGGKAHPRLYGTFPRILAKYVREEQVLPLEHAIFKMTGLPAQQFNIPERGFIAPAMIADLVLFDAETVRDVGDYRDPAQAPQGIRYVIQEGHMVAHDSAYYGPKRGRRLKPASSSYAFASSHVS